MIKKLKRFLPILIIVVAMIAVYFSGAFHYLSFETLKAKHDTLKEFVLQHPILMPLSFIGVYITATALSIPGALFLSLLGGYLFAQPWSTLYVLIGATIGATLLFLAARTALGESLRKKAGPLLTKMEKGFKENAVSYLLFLRFVPLFPFWLVNLAPAFFNVPLRTFVWTTAVGILPGAFVFTQAGAGLNAIFENEGVFSVHTILNTQLKIALVCLGIFALIPVAIKKYRARKTKP